MTTNRDPDRPPYGTEVSYVLAKVCDHLAGALSDIIQAAVSNLTSAQDFSEYWSSYSPDEQAIWQVRLRDHVAYILDPDADEATHRSAAFAMGYAHELQCFELTLISRVYKSIFRALVQMLDQPSLTSEEREVFEVCLAHRLMIDTSCQAKSHYDYQSRICELFICLDRIVDSSSNMADLLLGLCNGLATLDGISAVMLARPDASGIMQIEGSDSGKGALYAAALAKGLAPMFSIFDSQPSGGGPAGRAWRTKTIQISNSTFADDTIAAWRDLRVAMGIRSSAAIPLNDASGEPVALLSIYSDVTGYFSNAHRALTLRFIQQCAGSAIKRFQEASVIPIVKRQYYLELLEAGRVEMFYQPIIELKSGRLTHAEALARLKDASGNVISPAEFLPVLGHQGLHTLFRLGLETVCQHQKLLRSHPRFSDISLSINLPAEGLSDKRYIETFFEVIARHGISGHRLIIEVLESQDSAHASVTDNSISTLRAAGVRVVQDDLGAGHSSLLRLDRVEFDGVKIDQALVRRASTRPWRALEFMYHLTNLAQDVHVPVTIEGLENDGLVEAATIFGADYGQGYAIAKPMRFDLLVDWPSIHSAQLLPVSAPRHALGIMAQLLLWERAQKTQLRRGSFGMDAMNDMDIDLEHLNSPSLDPVAVRFRFKNLKATLSDGLESDHFMRARNLLITLLKDAWLKDQATIRDS